MDRFVIKKSRIVQATANANTTTESSSANAANTVPNNPAVPQLIDLNKLSRDPSKRKRMADFHPQST